MRTAHRWSSVVTPIILAVLLLPLRSDGDPQSQCINTTTSLASTVSNPIPSDGSRAYGDETFFSMPTGVADLMLLMDNSGSMYSFPQCGDNDWDGATAACKSPTIPVPANPTATSTDTNATPEKFYSVKGTCLPATDTGLTSAQRNTSAAWMEAVVPTTSLPDPGKKNTLMSDLPTWGGLDTSGTTRACSGDACLFDPNAYYVYGSWTSAATDTHATRTASDVDASLPGGCKALNGTSVRNARTYGGVNVPISLGTDCQTCMTNHGFYIFRVRYISGWSGTTPTYSNSPSSGSNPTFYMKGTFLNASPPKFVTARKVIKDLAWMDDTNPTAKLNQIRLGLTALDCGSRAGKLVVPFGPSKANSWPPDTSAHIAKFAEARQALVNAVNGKLPDQVTNATGAFDPTDSCTPLGSSLFNVGQYFSSIGWYSSKFGTGGYYSGSWERTDFQETAGGTIGASWAGTGQCSICWGCSTNSVILVTDGMPNTEITFPVTIQSYDSTTYNSTANCGATGGCGSSMLPRVASWLHNNDLRNDVVMGGKQLLNIHTIGFNLVNTTAINVLRATANMGGGSYQNAANADELATALWNAVNQIIQRDNSFSAASASSLQTVQTVQADAYLTRFRPNSSPAWQGHLFSGALFDEFLNGCDSTKPNSAQPVITCPTLTSKTISANFNGDVDSSGNAVCNGVFLIDQDCDEMAEDPTTGVFLKKGLATAAVFPWDAGQVLSDSTKSGYKSASETATNARSIFTYIPNSSGVMTKTAFTTANVDALKPYMNITSAWCTALLTQLGISGGTDPIATCAKQVIYFVRGWDVLDMDSDSCAGPGKTNASTCPSGTSGEERDRANDSRTDDASKTFWKLGDIFHSSPAIVQAPIDEPRCVTGYERQCLNTLYGMAGVPNQTPLDSYSGLTAGSTVDAYDRYRLDNRTRPRVALVGANDGMLHAFAAGDADTSKPADALGVYSYTVGTGSELWAFVPFDLLPRLKDMLSNHQYMVDGSVMMRDVWVDGSGATSADGTKQKDEFHTMAIVGRRAGGTQFSALDVTDPANPVLKWSFPRPGSEDESYMGQSWTDFAPKPPPIGPVKISTDPTDPAKFKEQWIVMLNGGYDPNLVKGRAVFMADVWTGETLWRFTDDDFKSQQGYTSATSMFPVPAGVGLVDMGNSYNGVLDMDGFFDTATWGDMGGNVFVARFQTPGIVDAITHRVNNWFAARAFEEQRRNDKAQYASGRSEFFFLTANTVHLQPGIENKLYTLLGSGNREHIMQTGPACGPDNLFACCQAGCTLVTSSESDSYGACGYSNQFSCSSGQLVRAATTTTGTCGTAASCAAAPGNAFKENVALHFVCPGVTAPVDVTANITCDVNGQCFSCSGTAATNFATGNTGTPACDPLTPLGPNHDLSGTFTDPPRSRFYGFWSYGKDPNKKFADLATAKAFDANRFTDVTYTGCSGPVGGNCQLKDVTACTTSTCGATDDYPGWFYEYGHSCPASSCTASSWTDEKTANSATVVLGCVVWAGFRPVGASTATDPCSGSVGTPLVYQYVAEPLTGIAANACAFTNGTGTYRATARSTTSPPSGAIVRVTFSPTGQVAYSFLQLDAGSAPSNTLLGTRRDLLQSVYWLELPWQLHNCQHVSASACE